MSKSPKTSRFLKFFPPLLVLLLAFAAVGHGELTSQDETVQITPEFSTSDYSTVLGPDSKFSPVASFNGCTYFVWCNAARRPFVTKIDSSGAVTTAPLDPDTAYVAQNDGHHKFSLGIDSNGYIHVAGDMHNYPNNLPYLSKYLGKKIMYWVSNFPEDVSAFTFKGGDPVRAIPGYGFSYGSFYSDNNGVLYFMARGKVHEKGHWPGEHGVTLSRYDVTTQAWTELGGYPPPIIPQGPINHKALLWEDGGHFFAADPTRSWYQSFQCGLAFDKNNRMHFAAAINNDTSVQGTTNVVYGYSDDGGNTFKRANGITIATLPMRVDPGPSQGDIVRTGDSGGTCYVAVDANNNPQININKGVMYWQPGLQQWSTPVLFPVKTTAVNKNYIDPSGIQVFVGDTIYRSRGLLEEGYVLPVPSGGNIDQPGLRDTGILRGAGIRGNALTVWKAEITPHSWSHSARTSFDGSTTYVEGQENCGSSPDLTVAFWMNAAKDANMIPVDKEPRTGTKGWTVKVRTGGSIFFRVGSNSSSESVSAGAGAYTPGVDTHVAATFSNGTAKIYINGVLKNTVTGMTHTVDDTVTKLRLGIASSASTGEKFEGDLDGVRIFNRALSDDEINTLSSSVTFIHDQPETFDGAHSFLDAGMRFGSTPEMTVAIRINAGKVANMRVVDKTPRAGTKGWAILLRGGTPNGAVRFVVGGGNNSPGISISNAYSAGTPVHIACTFKDGMLKIYLDGVLKAQGAQPTVTPDELDTPLRFGIPSSVSVGEMFQGTADKMRVYDRALSDAEIAAIAAEP